jgi:hypothetical protein
VEGEAKKLGDELKGAFDKLEGKKAKADAPAATAPAPAEKPLRLQVTEVHSTMAKDGFLEAIIRVRHLL